jgi:hypothetical protein
VVDHLLGLLALSPGAGDSAKPVLIVLAGGRDELDPATALAFDAPQVLTLPTDDEPN